jgi:ankyrin repeat protein
MHGSATINQGDTIVGPTAFLAATQTADVEFMKTLIDLGADPLLTNEDNKTALMLAGRRTGTDEEVLATMQLALAIGVDIDAVDDNGETAMHTAAYKNRAEPIKLLAEKGASIEIWNRENRYGSTPLAIAVGYRRPRSFRPQPEAEAAIREVMSAAGVTPPEKVTGTAKAQQVY